MAKLYFRYGAMNCGKTTALLQTAYNYTEKGLNVIIIKPKVDKKGGDKIVSRLGIERKVDYLIHKREKILDVININKINCILVDEAQFLSVNQVKELWIITKLYDIPIICYGLKTNFKGEFFTGSKPLFELADTVDELETLCRCGRKAKFNARLVNGKFVNEGKEVAIDGIDAEYEPLCGKCYLEQVLNIK